MATLTHPVTVEEREPRTGGIMPPPAPPRDGKSEGPGPGFTPADRLRRYRIGLAVGLTPVLMLFVSFTSAYIVRQGLGDDWSAIALPPILWMNTIILLASSVTAEKARRMAGIAQESGGLWLGITLILGLGFLAGQWIAWKQLAAQGIFIASNPSSSFFYLLTGSHGAHLVGGVLALGYAALATRFHRPPETRRIVVDIATWYWHFMDLLWLYILGLVYLAQ
ncbi:MAG TPA: cytochrome c oxidase subunit 3 [Terriglobales bacterium]|nr:cytochrome c oxidase subunit 3 [Terriglobales bacterium]